MKFIELILALLGLLHPIAVPAPVSPALNPPANQTLSLIVEPDDGIVPILSHLNNATTSIDLVMYDLSDMSVEKALVAAQKRGVAVRVLLNSGYYGASSMNKASYAYLQENGVPVHWTPSAFALTHEKSIVVDRDDALILSFNFTPKYYSSSRDFGIEDRDATDTADLEKVFDADWNGTTITPPTGDDLVWSPHSEDELVSLIAHAEHSVLIYNEEMSDVPIINALVAAASRGVSVSVVMTYQTSWKSAFSQLAAAGVGLHTFPDSTKAPIYIHAKMIVIDQKEAFVGSENFSANSLDKNRELGIFITKPAVVSALVATFGADWTLSS